MFCFQACITTHNNECVTLWSWLRGPQATGQLLFWPASNVSTDMTSRNLIPTGMGSLQSIPLVLFSMSKPFKWWGIAHKCYSCAGSEYHGKMNSVLHYFIKLCVTWVSLPSPILIHFLHFNTPPSMMGFGGWRPAVERGLDWECPLCCVPPWGGRAPRFSLPADMEGQQGGGAAMEPGVGRPECRVAAFRVYTCMCVCVYMCVQMYGLDMKG